MPFLRPTLSELRAQVAADISSALPGSDPLLKYSALKILGDAQSGLSHLHYGYTDWVARQSVPFTATDEFLDGWAALKNVFRLSATQATGSVTFTGVNGLTIPSGTPLTRGDGIGYTTTSDGTVSGGFVTVTAIANEDTEEVSGAFGNCVVGTSMTLGTSIAGIQSSGTASTAFTGGTDAETDESLRSRMLQAFQNPAQGGAQSDYVTWALQVPGVTRAWCNPNGYGTGSAVVYTMMDAVESANNGFPKGVGGVATSEARYATKATLDLLAVADHIYPLRPVTSLVFSVAPIATPINFTISGIPAALRDSVKAAISGVFVLYGSPVSDTQGLNTEIDMSYIQSAIAAISGTTGFVVSVPAGNIQGTTGQLPVLGTVTWI